MIRHLLILASVAALPAMGDAAKFDAAVATNQLGLDLYRQLAKANPGGNIVISPYSIDSALALAYSGANGATRAEMAKVLHFPDDDAPLLASFGKLRESLDEIARASMATLAEGKKYGYKGESIEWRQANRLYGQNDYAFRPSFLTLMKEGYGAPFEPLDFKTKPDAARETINSWVSQQTHQRIRDLIPKDGVASGTRLVLVNALYLKAPWQKPFEETDTQLRPYHLPGAGVASVPTMQRTAYLEYEKEPGFTVVALDYVGFDLQFVIILPDEGISCEAISDKLTPEIFGSWARHRGRAHPTRIELYLPKFRVEGASLSLAGLLSALGIKQAFDQPSGSADFSRIAPRRPDDYLALSEIFHKTFIEVSENGTEAAAATVMMMIMGSGIELSPPKPVVVRVDRPFLFAIQHRASGACLFLGRITDPR